MPHHRLRKQQQAHAARDQVADALKGARRGRRQRDEQHAHEGQHQHRLCILAGRQRRLGGQGHALPHDDQGASQSLRAGWGAAGIMWLSACLSRDQGRVYARAANEQRTPPSPQPPCLSSRSKGGTGQQGWHQWAGPHLQACTGRRAAAAGPTAAGLPLVGRTPELHQPLRPLLVEAVKRQDEQAGRQALAKQQAPKCPQCRAHTMRPCSAAPGAALHAARWSRSRLQA